MLSRSSIYLLDSRAAVPAMLFLLIATLVVRPYGAFAPQYASQKSNVMARKRAPPNNRACFRFYSKGAAAAQPNDLPPPAIAARRLIALSDHGKSLLPRHHAIGTLMKHERGVKAVRAGTTDRILSPRHQLAEMPASLMTSPICRLGFIYAPNSRRAGVHFQPLLNRSSFTSAVCSARTISTLR